MNPYIVTAAEMRELDRYAIEEIGIPALVLMENAGRAVYEEIRRFVAETRGEEGGKRWLVLAGKGNNGADGVVAARHLAEAGWEATVAYVADPASFQGEAAVQRDIAAHLGLPSLYVTDERVKEIDWGRFDGVVDALLGTGSRGAPKGTYAALIEAANASGLPIIAADIPSGLDADTGLLHEPCIQAARTVTFAFRKRGLTQYPGASAAGDTIVRSIGIPAQAAEKTDVRTFWLDKGSFRTLLGLNPVRPRVGDSHKGTYGHVLVVGGSRAMSGAGMLASRAALRGGCGLVTWAVPDKLVEMLGGRMPEATLSGLPDSGSGEWSAVAAEPTALLAAGKDAVVVGPGLGRWGSDTDWLRKLWLSLDEQIPLVLDADALNMAAAAPDFAAWPSRSGGVVLTPHPGEMGRLAGLPTREVQRDRIELARAYATRHHVTLVLKGAGTVVATPEGEVYVNGTGNAGMATGGSGDVLAGLIGSLLAQGLTANQAAAYGVWLHGAAGDRAAAVRPSPASLIASDIIEAL